MEKFSTWRVDIVFAVTMNETDHLPSLYLGRWYRHPGETAFCSIKPMAS